MSLATEPAAQIASLRSSGPECPACSAAEVRQRVAVPDHEYGLSHLACYLECQKCETCYQHPMPTLDELANFYPSDYHSMTHAGLLATLRNGVRIKRLLNLLKCQGPVLDYGCGDGDFLLQASRKAPDRRFWGFEIAARSETVTLAGGAVIIVRGNLADLLDVLPPCSLITLNHVIEHLPDPSTVVTALAGKLLPGGVFEGQTPAADSLERSVFGARWSGYHSPRHTVVFSRAGLCRMLQRCGLQLPATRGAFNPASLAVSLASLPQSGSGRIRRGGTRWLCLLAAASALAPLDLFSGRPAIMDFVAYKAAE